MKTGRETRTCYCCNKSFEVFVSDANAGAGKYCSVPCKNLGAGMQLEVLAAMPGTGVEISARLGTDHTMVMQAVTRLVKKGLVRIVGVVEGRPPADGKIYSRFVLYFEKGPQLLKGVPTNLRQALGYFYDRMILEAMPGTKKQIEMRTGIDKATVLKRIDLFHKAKTVHVSKWRKGKQGSYMAVYAIGKRKDAKCKLGPLTAQEKYQRYMNKIDRTGKREAYRLRNLLYKRHSDMRKKHGDPLINALFGAPSQRKQKQEIA